MASESRLPGGITSRNQPMPNKRSKERRTDSSESEEDINDTTQELDAKSNEIITACLQVLGAFFLMFNSWGIVNTFGAYQAYYEVGFLFDQTPSNISWIGSIQACLLLVVGGPLTGPIFDAGYLRSLIVVGSIVSVFGMMMTSICREYWQIILSQGLVVGMGSGCMMLPSIAVMPQYFTHKRALATGIAASGGSLGGVIYPIVFHKLQPRIGFGWATRVIAFLMLGTLAIPVTVMRAKVFPATTRPFIDWKVLRNLPYDFFSVGSAFGFMGMYIPFYYITTYSVEKGIVDANLGFYLLTILNTASIFGRIVPNFFADITGPLNITIPFISSTAIIALCWPSLHSTGTVVAFCIFYGFVSGTFVSMTGPVLVSLSPNLAFVGTHMGMSLALAALGLLIGNPVAGALLNAYGWTALAMFCGTANILATAFIIAARIKKSGLSLRIKI